MAERGIQERVAHIEGQMAGYEVRFDRIEKRIDDLSGEMRAGFERVDRRFDSMDRRFEAIDRRFEAVDARFERLEAGLVEMREQMVRGFAAVDRRFDWQYRWLTGLIVTSWATVMAALAGAFFVIR